MCIICVKPTGVDIPLQEIFDNCATTNRDGIGFSWALPGEQVHIAKGFKNVAKLMRALDSCNITKEHNLIVHFRLATHGACDAGNCHPFPLTSKFEEMRYLNCTCDTSIAHNGVFGGMPASQKYSDTMKFIGGILASPEIIENINSPAVKTLIKGYCGFSSKLAFLRSTGITMIGDFEQENGMFYSNRQFKKYSYVSTWEKNKNGQEYCYLHKAYDDCQWCSVHLKMDSCAHDKKTNTVKKWKDRFGDIHKDTKLIDYDADVDLRTKCEYCEDTSNVKWNNDWQSFLCNTCLTMYAGQEGIGY